MFAAEDRNISFARDGGDSERPILAEGGEQTLSGSRSGFSPVYIFRRPFHSPNTSSPEKASEHRKPVPASYPDWDDEDSGNFNRLEGSSTNSISQTRVERTRIAHHRSR
ncbi:hypothetical protein GJ744_009647 [Endocarpon pusillum]|uniref:Uncharacterized protein n=1 Tax=Endocarpon pusillum TaxID=364733 RepID=A0A8H7AFD1_9EURO|nr:hypothetical protein GJ744_009647 [Endocarpon pusillum]